MTATEVARLVLPTAFGPFYLRAFEASGENVYLALIKGDVTGGDAAPVRVHSECLTGDALGSLRCDCGTQLRTSLRTVAAAGRGIVLYVTGHEGRGVGLVNKLRAYIEQDGGADTIDANLHLGLPAEARDYAGAAEVLLTLGAANVKLMTNNPAKAEALARHGVEITEVLPVPVAPGRYNNGYLLTKQSRLGHRRPTGNPLEQLSLRTPDVTGLLGGARTRKGRPWVTIKYAQSLDGRIATATGDSKWISSAQERALSHALRAGSDAVLVGVGTVVNDDPRLTVRLVPGASPVRIVLDSTLRIPAHAAILDEDAPTVVITTSESDPSVREKMQSMNVIVRVVPRSVDGVDLEAALRSMWDDGITSLLVEGGSGVITSFLRAKLVDRVIVSIAPLLLGNGIEAVADLGVTKVVGGLRLKQRAIHYVDGDIVVAYDLERSSLSGEILDAADSPIMSSLDT